MGAQAILVQAWPQPRASLPKYQDPQDMGGHSRFFHPNFFTRYIWGSYATIHLAGFIADQSYGVDRTKNPDIMWPWWHEIMRKKEKGEIPMNMPGYMLVKYLNEA